MNANHIDLSVSVDLAISLKSIKAAYLFAALKDHYRLVVLHEKESVVVDDNYWFSCTSEHIKSQYGMSYKEQTKCISLLKQANLIETKLIGVPAKKHFTFIKSENPTK